MTLETTQLRASIIHGYGAGPEDHWFGWLAEQLRADGIPTTVPALPNSQDPDAEEWTDAVRNAVGTVDEHSIVVAHSLGCLSVLRCLRSIAGHWRLGTLVLVSGFLEPLPALPLLDGFIGNGCDVTGLADRIDRLTIIRSDDDQYVPPPHTDRLASLLGASTRVITGAGHFLASDGVTSLREVHESIMS